ncbi:MAG: glycosyltransferase [Oligoflexia bacterium]|nr:glycosyltransferase [Oligoflexia bacterium]
MKVLMLGWEYPPHISGGLGTACEGLTRALSRHGAEIQFVVPSLFGGEHAPHMALMDSRGGTPKVFGDLTGKYPATAQPKKRKGSKAKSGIKTIRIPALLSPYLRPESYDAAYQAAGSGLGFTAIFDLAVESEKISLMLDDFEEGVGKARYGSDIFKEVARYTAQVIALCSELEFDVIHAHDWMTYPAAVALSQLSKKPLIVHVHSLEYDRSGEAVNPSINQIEHFGLHAADMVVAVSYYTRSVIQQRHAIATGKVRVVHNGVYPRTVVQRYRSKRLQGRRIVLFLGRVTFQKGPDYFVEAAARVVPHVPDVLFVLAGSGDMLPRMMQRVQELGLGAHFEFPGFLKGHEVEEMYSLADVYVMPSVSEPFGISALEAISFDTPVIISRQSGVSEVLAHALKVDFWDVHRLADLIINALLHNELRQDMVAMAREELKRLRWDASALRMLELYRRLA